MPHPANRSHRRHQPRTFAYVAQEDLNHDGTDSAADDALFDESYTDNLGLSGRGRLTAAKLNNRKGYAGYEHDESLTMYQVRHRVYRPDLGRWMTRDPLGYVDGMGLYEYVGGMAVKGSDPSGLQVAVPGVCFPLPCLLPTPAVPLTTDQSDPTCRVGCNKAPFPGGFTLWGPDGRPIQSCVCLENIKTLVPNRYRQFPIDIPGESDAILALIRCTADHERHHSRQFGGSRNCRECESHDISVQCLIAHLNHPRCQASASCVLALQDQLLMHERLYDCYCSNCNIEVKYGRTF